MSDHFPVLGDEDLLGSVGIRLGGDELDARVARGLDDVSEHSSVLSRSCDSASFESLSLLPQALLGPLLYILEVLVEDPRLLLLAGVEPLRGLDDGAGLPARGEPLPLPVHAVPVGLDLPQLQRQLLHPDLLHPRVRGHRALGPLPLPQPGPDGAVVHLLPGSVQGDGDLPLPVLSGLHVSADVPVLQDLRGDDLIVGGHLVLAVIERGRLGGHVVPLDGHPQDPQLHRHGVETRHARRAEHPRGPEQRPRAGVGPRLGVGLGVVVEAVDHHHPRVPGQPLELVLHQDQDASHLLALA